MSRFAHRQPAWGTISVVLFSALFLSPMTGAALLHALALDASWRLANPHLVVASEDTTPQQQTPSTPKETTPSPVAAPRRTSEEEAALRRAAAALRGQIRPLRLHTDPDEITSVADALVVLLPKRTVLLVPDIGAPDSLRRPSDDVLLSRDGARLAIPRAPPA